MMPQERQHLLFVAHKFKESMVTRHPQDEDALQFQFSFDLPIHFRYGAASQTHFYFAYVDMNPRVFFNCFNLSTMATKSKSLSSFEDFLSQKLDLRAQEIPNYRIKQNQRMQLMKVKVPVGHNEHRGFALVSTAAMAFCGVLTVGYIAFFVRKNDQ